MPKVQVFFPYSAKCTNFQTSPSPKEQLKNIYLCPPHSSWDRVEQRNKPLHLQFLKL